MVHKPHLNWAYFVVKRIDTNSTPFRSSLLSQFELTENIISKNLAYAVPLNWPSLNNNEDIFVPKYVDYRQDILEM